MSLVRTRTRFSRLRPALAAAALVLACGSVVSAGEGDAKKDETDRSRAAKGAQQAQEKAEEKADERAEGKSAEKAAPSLASIAAAAAERRRQAAAKSEVITTEELQRRFSAGTMSGVYQAEGDATAGSDTAAGTAPDAMPPPAAGDPLMALQQQRADAAARMRAVEQAEAEVNTLRARIQELERRALAVSNPYLPRPKVDRDDKSAEGWDEMDAEERRAQTQKAIADTKERLAQAEKRLAELRSGRGEF